MTTIRLIAIMLLVFFVSLIAIIAAHASPRHMGAADVRVIPHPAGCPARLFCACGLAHLWHVADKPGINKVSNWPRLFPRAAGPGVHRAAVRIGGYHDHVVGIIGGGPGAWEVVDFNSGRGLSHSYVASSFPGYFFVEVGS